jgi:hypothetical protein
MNFAFEGADVPDIDEGPAADHLGLTVSDHEMLRALGELLALADGIEE